MAHEPSSADFNRSVRPGPALPPATLVAFAAVMVAVLVIAALTYRALDIRSDAADRVTSSLETIEALHGVMAALTNAETSQRGYLLTGAETYLQPFVSAPRELATHLATLRRTSVHSPQFATRLPTLERLSAERLADLGQAIDLRRAGNLESSTARVRSDSTKAAMDALRVIVDRAVREERAEAVNRQALFADAAAGSYVALAVGTSVLLAFILAAGVAAARGHRARQTQQWLREGQRALSEALQGDDRLDVLGGKALAVLTHWLQAPVGAAYSLEAGLLRRFAAHALASGADVLQPGEGLVGQAAADNRTCHVRDVPPGHLAITSATGSSSPKELVIAPASVDGVVQAVIELGFLHPVGSAELELLALASQSLAIALRTAKDRTRLEELLSVTQKQGEVLQTQQEELRVSNEELEEQGRALRETRSHLQAEQLKLQAINTELEQQAEVLQKQQDALTLAHTVLTHKATEVEHANLYKSEFLANMSHELRTPLNSSLILSKLLADNAGGNLSAEQVKFAQTIHSAGNDLLLLVNDILDLSKIEAGKTELHAEPVGLARTLEGLKKTFAPMAQGKGLRFSAAIEPGTPETIDTDVRRLEQILKNLLSNALKFTESGSVSLRILSPSPDTVSFVVQDTGIGIATEQQALIFEPFRQADGSTHRKYGGTGLGLSISRQLAGLLGGTIEVQSIPGAGSTFTLSLPRAYRLADALAPAAAIAMPAVVAAVQLARNLATDSGVVDPASQQAVPNAVDDDRGQLLPSLRRVLVIEDDIAFATILRDLVRETGYQCLVAHRADDGLAAAVAHLPSAVLLDMNLPDHSGMGVLDQLKRNPLTRHIPVHVVSVADYSREALELGAIGYALKPVNREQLVAALHHLEAKFSQQLKRLLIVEDDQRQRESMRELLDNGGVHITCVENAADALVQLRAATFDCVVMDLNLPDASGYELLETMAGHDDVSFPPVIVYTGRSLSRDEEHKLRRHSRSIIIKDARSPERLLDEVTLFLHQVEGDLPADRQRMLQAVRSREASFEGRRILVVEDDVRNIFALSSVLEPKGVKVEIARNGREAIDALSKDAELQTGGIDLVLMDIMMPVMDGYEAMREIRTHRRWNKLPIIALTAKAMKDDHEKCIAAGATDFMAKPLDVEKLLSLIRVWMPK